MGLLEARYYPCRDSSEPITEAEGQSCVADSLNVQTEIEFDSDVLVRLTVNVSSCEGVLWSVHQV